MNGSPHNTQEELAAYAMQNLALEESASIRSHLLSCELCRVELAQVAGDLSLLGLSLPLQPLPDGMRARFLQRIAAPAVTPVAVMKARRGPGYWVAWGTAAASAIVAISLGVQNHALNDELRDESKMVSNLAAQASRAQQVLEVLTAPTAQRVTLTEGKAVPAPSARATYLPERGGVILLATNLKPLPPDKAYELWVIPANGTAAVAAGVFRPDASGTATLVLPTLAPGIPAKAFGVTVESASGSAAPTSPIILSGAVSGS